MAYEFFRGAMNYLHIKVVTRCVSCISVEQQLSRIYKDTVAKGAVRSDARVCARG